jgi:hypothetical protein
MKGDGSIQACLQFTLSWGKHRITLLCSVGSVAGMEGIHCKEPMPKIRNKYVPEKELLGHSPYFHIYVSVSDLYIPTIDLSILPQEYVD